MIQSIESDNVGQRQFAVGFTTLITSAIASLHRQRSVADHGAVADREPTLAPTWCADIEPIFAASPVLQNVLESDEEHGKRNTLLQRGFKGGHFLKILPAMAPHNLACSTTSECCSATRSMGTKSRQRRIASTLLAIGRTMSYPNRKIVLGSTPKDKDTSTIIAAYAESDQRVFECPCPLCGGFTELKWKHIVWPKDHPEEAKFKCPHCESLIDETLQGADGGKRRVADRRDQR